MTGQQTEELLDLYLDEELPEALQAHIEAYLAAHPDAAEDVNSLRETITRLRAIPAERPDAWFIERTLDRLLHEHMGAQAPAREAPPAPKFGGARR